MALFQTAINSQDSRPFSFLTCAWQGTSPSFSVARNAPTLKMSALARPPGTAGRREDGAIPLRWTPFTGPRTDMCHVEDITYLYYSAFRATSLSRSALACARG